MNKVKILLLPFLSILPLIIGCSSVIPEVGSGYIITRSAAFNDNINRFDFSHACEASIVQSESSYVVISIDDNLMDDVDIDTNGSTLSIGMEPGAHNPTEFKATVYCRSLIEASGSGASEITITEFSPSDEEFISNLSGASSLEAELICTDVTLDISGASTITLTGSGDDLSLDCSGASEVNMKQFSVDDVEIELSGASEANINAEGTISGSVSGASELNYYGTATLNSLDVSGASDVTKR